MLNQPSLILASQSPRRVELLKQIKIPFIQRAVAIDEKPIGDEKPELYVLRMALEKAKASLHIGESKDVVLGSDTAIAIEGEIFGKPKDQADSMRMLSILSDNTHQVLTAVAIVTATQHKHIVVPTQVTFGPLSQKQIKQYWQTGEPKDKAGSYAIQGLGGQFVKHIQGSYSAVVGLPLYQTKTLLAELGITHEC
ncbi:Maf family protein [Paraglaciecola marina]|uniref:Maf family protein n=1 Tax=Paraglaciecola marina TaxID=2500157 RepID=UPI00105EA04E|nr:Maf family protein [Paraglaciecola marina]